MHTRFPGGRPTSSRGLSRGQESGSFLSRRGFRWIEGMEAVGAEKGGGCPVDGPSAKGTPIPSQSTQNSEASESAPEAVVTESRSVESLWEELAALKGVLGGEQIKQGALEIGTGQLDVGNRRKMVGSVLHG